MAVAHSKFGGQDLREKESGSYPKPFSPAFRLLFLLGLVGSFVGAGAWLYFNQQNEIAEETIESLERRSNEATNEILVLANELQDFEFAQQRAGNIESWLQQRIYVMPFLASAINTVNSYPGVELNSLDFTISETAQVVTVNMAFRGDIRSAQELITELNGAFVDNGFAVSENDASAQQDLIRWTGTFFFPSRILDRTF